MQSELGPGIRQLKIVSTLLITPKELRVKTLPSSTPLLLPRMESENNSKDISNKCKIPKSIATNTSTSIIQYHIADIYSDFRGDEAF